MQCNATTGVQNLTNQLTNQTNYRPIIDGGRPVIYGFLFGGGGNSNSCIRGWWLWWLCCCLLCFGCLLLACLLALRIVYAI